ncbi:SDR family oxidoreductase [Gramella sp. AN32]|uniref:SDR family oxidoreductase n=1 Tax=Christiangramia antarctica TaxID=2058158 RepID=A0ABW5X1S0_9FLAO|nr:SDR family oxidoreductase [Gramella sp. AN32]MCM4156925.1 short chain dehydrogenase [Gramella sp. AN32]
MDLKLQNKVIIVTGGSKGIGNGICNLLAEEGAIPVIIGRNKENVLDAVKRIEEKGGKAYHAFAELTNPQDCIDAVARTAEKFGRIDGVVNNAGVNDSIGLEKGNYEDFMVSIQRNLAHYYLITQEALPYLKENKGSVVNIGSKSAFTGQGGTSGYAAANGGRNALTREWAVELLPYSIRVNAVIVAECFTPLYKKWINTFPEPEKKLNNITSKIPLEQRMTSTEEIANMVAFLLSSKSSHTTGQQIFVDGGYTHLDRALT